MNFNLAEQCSLVKKFNFHLAERCSSEELDDLRLECNELVPVLY
jgi:hypothetical protein